MFLEIVYNCAVMIDAQNSATNHITSYTNTITQDQTYTIRNTTSHTMLYHTTENITPYRTAFHIVDIQRHRTTIRDLSHAQHVFSIRRTAAQGLTMDKVLYKCFTIHSKQMYSNTEHDTTPQQP